MKIELSHLIIFVGLFILKNIVWDWLVMKRGNNGDSGKRINRINEDVKWLKDAHNKDDEDGIKVWYFPRRTLKLLDDQLNLLREIHLVLKSNGDKLDNVNKKGA